MPTTRGRDTGCFKGLLSRLECWTKTFPLPLYKRRQCTQLLRSLPLLQLGQGRSLYKEAMRQRKLGSHTPPCHRRMVVTTMFSVLLAALQRRPVLYHTRWLLNVLWLWSSGH